MLDEDEAPGTVREVGESLLVDAKVKAVELRHSIERLSPVEKMMGAQYLKPVLRLIEAVDSL